jgi:hypothetical protein
MIHVAPRPEPPDFDDEVRRPGKAAQAKDPQALPDLWRKCLKQLWEAYEGVCAYLAVRIPPGVGAKTIDHLAPKKKNPDLAYEWVNYRLVCSLMNARKSHFEDVLDPFEIEDGWFVLELSSLEVLPHADLKPSLRSQVQSTIDRLKLNDSECIAARAEHYAAYIEHVRDPKLGIPFGQLRRWNPFVAMELLRQEIVEIA